MKIEYDDLIFTSRGSTALLAVLKSLGKPGTKVLLPVNVCEIVYPVIIDAGYLPVFYDVNQSDGNARLDDIVVKYDPAVSVLLAVHNFGMPLEIDSIARWSFDNNVFLVEDVCNAIGASFQNVSLGRFGDASIYSFGYAKIVEVGIGGAAYVKDNLLREKVVSLISKWPFYSEQIKNEDSDFVLKIRELRKNPDLQIPSVYKPLYASYLDSQLYQIELKIVNEIKDRLWALDENLKERERKVMLFRTGIVASNAKHMPEVKGQVYWRYNFTVPPELRDELVWKLRKNGVLVSAWYPPIINLFDEHLPSDLFPGADSFGKRIINLFIDHRVSDPDILKAVIIINEFLK